MRSTQGPEEGFVGSVELRKGPRILSSSPSSPLPLPYSAQQCQTGVCPVVVPSNFSPNAKLVCVQLLYRPTSLPVSNWFVCLVVVPSLSPFSQCQTGVYPVVGTTTGYTPVLPSLPMSNWCVSSCCTVQLLSKCQTGVCPVVVPSNFSPNAKLVCVSSCCTVPLSLLPISGWCVSSCTVLPSLPMSNRCVSSRCTVPLSLLPMSNWCVSSCCTVQLLSQCQTEVCPVFCTVKLLSQCQAGVCPVVVPSSLLSQCQTGVCLVVVPSLSPFSQCQTG